MEIEWRSDGNRMEVGNSGAGGNNMEIVLK